MMLPRHIGELYSYLLKFFRARVKTSFNLIFPSSIFVRWLLKSRWGGRKTQNLEKVFSICTKKQVLLVREIATVHAQISWLIRTTDAFGSGSILKFCHCFS